MVVVRVKPPSWEVLALVVPGEIGSGESHEAGCEAHGVYARRQGLCGLQSRVLGLLMWLVRLIDARAQLPKRDRRGLGSGTWLESLAGWALMGEGL